MRRSHIPSLDSGGGPFCGFAAFEITPEVSLVGSGADDASAAFGEAMLRVVLVFLRASRRCALELSSVHRSLIPPSHDCGPNHP